ncbi:MAG: dienelactone hydrolase family protein [Janthinobacterium lividum]
MSKKFAQWITLLCLSLPGFSVHSQQTARSLNESVFTVDVKVSDLYGREETRKVVVSEFKPAGDGSFPVLILNHGRGPNRNDPPRFRSTRQVHFFIERGFAVFVPTRIGYGAEGTNFDPESSGACNNKQFDAEALAGSSEILAVLDHARQLPAIDSTRVVLVGQSVGGFLSTATAARNPPGLLAAINFAGGGAGDPQRHPGIPCQGERMEKMFTRFGSSAKVPMLWIYTENDQYFNPSYS